MGASHFGDVKQAFFQSQMKMTKHVYTDEKTASKYLFTGPTYQLINLSSKSKTKKKMTELYLYEKVYIYNSTNIITYIVIITWYMNCSAHF